MVKTTATKPFHNRTALVFDRTLAPSSCNALLERLGIDAPGE